MDCALRRMPNATGPAVFSSSQIPHRLYGGRRPRFSRVAGAKLADLKQSVCLAARPGSEVASAESYWTSAGLKALSLHIQHILVHADYHLYGSTSSVFLLSVNCWAFFSLFTFVVFVCCSRLLRWLQKKKTLHQLVLAPLHVSDKKLSILLSFFLFFFQLISVCAVFRSSPFFCLQKRNFSSSSVPALFMTYCMQYMVSIDGEGGWSRSIRLPVITHRSTASRSLS